MKAWLFLSIIAVTSGTIAQTAPSKAVSPESSALRARCVEQGIRPVDLNKIFKPEAQKALGIAKLNTEEADNLAWVLAWAFHEGFKAAAAPAQPAGMAAKPDPVVQNPAQAGVAPRPPLVPVWNQPNPAAQQAAAAGAAARAARAVARGGGGAAGGGGVIETQLDGEWEGWDGDTVVKLLNGQIWQQVDGHYEYSYGYMPEVLIYPSGGSWKMRVEGCDESVSVERLK